MPVTVLDRIPLPTFKTYLAVSVALLSMSTYYAVNVTNDSNWKAAHSLGNSPDQTPRPKLTDKLFLIDSTSFLNKNNSFIRRVGEVFGFMMQETICTWTVVNMAYCCLALLGLSVQRMVFGKLRISEIQHIKDKFWNFVFYKFIFIFGIINVQYMEEVLLWCTWFSLLGFLQMMAQLCKDRFEYLSFSPTTPGWSHVKLLILLTVIQLISFIMLVVCVGVGYYAGLNTFAFMAAECILLSMKTLHVIFRYVLHLYESYDSHNSRNESVADMFASVSDPSTWDKRAPFAHHIEFLFEVGGLIVDLVHHIHMLLWSNIFLSMASLIICLQLRFIFHEMRRKVRKHKNYLWVMEHMDRTYPMATSKEIAENSDNCAICWEKMDSARKLPCTHLFHNTCLSQWLQQDTSCPTCRATLPIWDPTGTGAGSTQRHRGALNNRITIRRVNGQEMDDPVNVIAAEEGGAEGTPRQPLNHFFHFDGSRYFSWLPSFSVEVTQMRADDPATTSQLDGMARQVQQLFPHFPLSVISQDLQVTRSVEITVENILEGHLVLPNRFIHVDDRMSEDNMLTEAGPSQPSVISEEQISIPAHSGDDGFDSAPLPDGEPTFSGGRFSKSSSERENILQRRKEQTIAKARKKYLERNLQKVISSDPNAAPSGSDNSPSTSARQS